MRSDREDPGAAESRAAAKSPDTAESPSAAEEGVRLQKVLASAGVASRRVAEELIVAGRVRVNGTVVRELGSRVNPERDTVAVDGSVVQLDSTKRYVMLNKPVGVVSSLADDRGRPDLRVYTSRFGERLFNVGRLDFDTSGLLLLTNDGELAHVLAHPSFGVMKTYVARVRGRVTPQTVSRLTSGIELEDGPIAADKARLISTSPGGGRGGDSLLEITLHSGRNRIVRRMLDEVGHPVIDLVRRAFGPLNLGSLRIGEMRELTAKERGDLLTLAKPEAVARQRSQTDERAGNDGAAPSPEGRSRGGSRPGRLER